MTSCGEGCPHDPVLTNKTWGKLAQWGGQLPGHTQDWPSPQSCRLILEWGIVHFTLYPNSKAPLLRTGSALCLFWWRLLRNQSRRRRELRQPVDALRVCLCLSPDAPLPPHDSGSQQNQLTVGRSSHMVTSCPGGAAPSIYQGKSHGLLLTLGTVSGADATTAPEPSMSAGSSHGADFCARQP